MDCLKTLGWFWLFLPMWAVAQTSTPVLALAVSADHTLLATGTLDGLLRVRDLATGEEQYRQRLLGGEGILTLRFETSQSLLIGARDGTFWRWATPSGQIHSATVPQSVKAQTDVLSPDKSFIARPMKEGRLQILENLSEKLVAEAAVGEVGYLIWAPFGVLIADDRTLVLRRPSLEKLWSIPFSSRTTALATLGTHWAVTLADGRVFAGEGDGQSIVTWQAHTSGINAVVWADDRRLVTAGADSNVSIWSYPETKRIGSVLP